MQLLRKISAKTVYGDKADIQTVVLADREQAHPLFRVVGICNGTREGVIDKDQMTEEMKREASNKGKPPAPWKALLGQFEATNLKTGEIFRSGVCFLPQYAADIVAGQLGGDVENVRFAFTICAKFDKDSATSYVYEAHNLIEPSAEGDPLAELASQVQKALPGPTSR